MSTPVTPDANSDEQSSGAVAASFAKLDDPRSQRQALQNLVKALTPQRLRELKALVDPTDFRLDIISSLPMELVLEISKYLTLSQNFRATRVCRSWSRLLKSPPIIDFHLKPWFPNVECSLRIPEGSSATAAATIKAEYIDAYTHGTPVSRVVVKRKLPPGSSMTCSVYADGMIARVLKNGFGVANKCWIYHLERSFEESWAVFSDPHSTQAVTHLGISASVVAMILDSGDCYVWELSPSNNFSEGKRKSISMLGSRQVKTLVVSGSSLAILYESSSIKANITIWTLGAEAIHIAADAPEGLSEVLASQDFFATRQKIFIDYSSQAVVLFRLVEGSRVFICYTRYDFAGTLVSEANLEIPKGPDSARIIWGLASPACNGCIVVCVEQAVKATNGTRSYTPKVTRVVYDLNQDHLRLEETRSPSATTICSGKPEAIVWSSTKRSSSVHFTDQISSFRPSSTGNRRGSSL